MEEKSKRSRAACAPCRQTKQRCDGPSRIPCRRCELYNLHCEYKAPSGPAFVPKAARPSQAAIASTSSSNPTAASTSTQVVGGPASDALAEQLREISQRLKSIESALDQVSLQPKAPILSPSHQHSHPNQHSHPSPSNDSSTSSFNHPEPIAKGETPNPINTNPVAVIIEAILSIEQSAPIPREEIQVEDWLNPGGQTPSGSESTLSRFGGIVKPDAILRGILSLEEAEASFQIFHNKLSPWVMFFDLNDYSAADMKERHPLLFHVILLSTSYYLMRGSDRGTSVYYSLTSLVNELVAPFLISPQPRQITTDLVRALTLILLWKPIQFATLYEQGITDPILAEQASKLNGSASNALGATLVRIMATISLPAIPKTFSSTYSPHRATDPQILADLRLFYWLLAINTHAAVSIGIVTSVDLSEALKTTRLFASLRLLPYDIRLAATVELYGIVTRPTGSRQGFITDDLQSINRQLDEFERHWSMPLREAQSVDKLAYTVIGTFASFLRLVVNLSVYTRWKHERKLSLDSGGNGRPELSLQDWDHLEKAVAAAERMIFFLSTESNTELGYKEVRWPIKLDGLPRQSLHVDQSVVSGHICAIDTVTCVVYIYALIFLVKLANTGLIRCDLQSMASEYRANLTLNSPRQLVEGAKLGRLVELGAKFLDAIAPTNSHPAKKHAKMLRTLLAAGTSGQMIAIDPSETREKTSRLFPLPSPHLSARSSFGSTTPSHYSLPALHSPTSSQGEHGEALHSILSNLTPGFLETIGNWTSPDLESGLEGMKVDWDSLEKSLSRMEDNNLDHGVHNNDFRNDFF